MSNVANSGRTGDRGTWLGTNTHGGDSRAARSGFSVGALLLSLIFAVLLITDPQQLDAAWQWIRDLPIVFEVFAWLVLLPWMLAYLAWNAPWELWLRVVLVAILIGSFALNFWRSNNG